MATETSTPILTRIKITQAEWIAVRKAAIDANMSTSEYLAVAVRNHLESEGKPQ